MDLDICFEGWARSISPPSERVKCIETFICMFIYEFGLAKQSLVDKSSESFFMKVPKK